MVLHIGSSVGRECPTSYAAMDANQVGEYGEVKTMILRRYGVTKSHTGRSTIQQERGQRETNRDLALRIGDLNRKGMRECELVEEIRDLMNMEQLLEELPP